MSVLSCPRLIRALRSIPLPSGAVPAASFTLLGAGLLLSGCHHQKPVASVPLPPPALYGPDSHDSVRADRRSEPRPIHLPSSSSSSSASAAQPSLPADLNEQAALAPPGYFDDFHVAPVFTETGLTTWYGPNYNHHNAADGTVYDQNAMTAAHRTLPLGSTVRVTNLQNGQQVLVRITDRGPFAPGRVLDLSMGAAKAIGVYRVGVAKVRVEGFPHLTSNPDGRWCVQTGAFKDQTDALDLKAALLERYRTAKVIEFAGPTGYWVRIDPASRSKSQAEEVLTWIGNPDPAAAPYLVRTD